MGFTYRQGHDGRLSIEEMDNNFLYAEEQIGSLTASIVGLEQSIDDIVTVIAGITASEALQDATVIAGLTASVITLNTNLASATASIVTLNTNLASATASIATLNTNLASVTASVVGLEDTVLGLGLAATGLSASVDTIISNVAGLTASVIDLQNAFSNINGSFNFLLLVGGVTQSGTFSFTNGILGTYSI